MSNKPIIVLTGGTSGLGQLAAIELAKHGAHLVLTARSQERAKATEIMIKTIQPSMEIDFFLGDLSLLKDVMRIGKEITAAYPIIDVLINNAGIHAFEQRITSEGFSEMIAVNYLAPWLLTQIMLPSLKKAESARVINVASEASRNHGVLKMPEDLTDTTPFTSRGSSALYGKTKLLNIMFTGELARQLIGTSVSANALNPGFNVTGLGRELKFASVLKRILNFFHVGDPNKGAEIIVRLAVETKYHEASGGYFNVGTGNPIEPVHPGSDSTMQNKLWHATKDLLKQKGYLE
jgi:NAD(P)-dependent dehydrogenase (short-subunit alcohol dehydrogenase family)